MLKAANETIKKKMSTELHLASASRKMKTKPLLVTDSHCGGTNHATSVTIDLVYGHTLWVRKIPGKSY